MSEHFHSPSRFGHKKLGILKNMSGHRFCDVFVDDQGNYFLKTNHCEISVDYLVKQFLEFKTDSV